VFALIFLITLNEFPIFPDEAWQPIGNQSIVFADNGSFFILLPDIGRVVRYKSSATQLSTFGRLGEGPGSFRTPDRLYWRNDRLIVTDGFGAHVFDGEGEHIRTQSYSDLGDAALVFPLRTHWLALSYSDPETGLRKLSVFSEEANHEKVIREWHEPVVVHRYQGGTRIARVNPTPDRSCLTISPEGDRIFLYQNDTASIAILDGKGDVIHRIKLPEPVPFDADWGRALLERYRNRKPRVTYKPDFPTHYPPVSRMEIIPGPYLWLTGYGAGGKPWSRVRTLDGHPASLPLPFEDYTRISAIHYGSAFVIVYEPETERWGLDKVALDSLESFIEKNPVPEWQ